MWEGYARPAPLHILYVGRYGQNETKFLLRRHRIYHSKCLPVLRFRGAIDRGAGHTPPGSSTNTGAAGEQDHNRSSNRGGTTNTIINLYFPYSTTEGTKQTELALINTSLIHRLDGVLKAFDEKGREQSSISFEGTGYPVHLEARERKELLIEKAFPKPNDIRYLVFFADSDRCTGYTKVYIEGRYRAATPAVPEVSDGHIDLSSIVSKQDWWTRLALVNTTTMPTEATITLELINKTKQSASLYFGPDEQQTFIVADLFGRKMLGEISSGIIENASGTGRYRAGRR